MKKSIFTVAIIFSIFLTGCVTSLHSFVTTRNIITDNRIVGTWKYKDSEIHVQLFFNHSFYKRYKEAFDKEIKKFKKFDHASGDSVLLAKSYMIDYIKGDLHYYLLGGLTRINNQLYINFTPIRTKGAHDPENVDSGYEPSDSYAGNTLAKVSFENSKKLQLDFLNGSFIMDEIKAGHMKIKNERNDLYDTFLITASTEDLTRFIEKYGNDSRLYDKDNSVNLTRSF